jgi:hypothetical protein
MMLKYAVGLVGVLGLGLGAAAPLNAAAKKKTVTLYKVDKGVCGQCTLDAKYSKQAQQGGLKTGTCADKGYTQASGKQKVKVPTIGTVTIYKYVKPKMTTTDEIDGLESAAVNNLTVRRQQPRGAPLPPTHQRRPAHTAAMVYWFLHI